MKIKTLVYSFTCLLGVLFYSPMAFSQNNIPEDTRVESIDDTISKLKTAYSSQNYDAFIAVFPNNMAQFKEIYGFDDVSGGKPLYSDAYDHITYLFNEVTNETIDTLFKKAVGIATHSQWNADAENYFRYESLNLIKKHPERFLSAMSSKTVEESASVWYFLFDGPCPSNTKEIYKDIYDLIKPLNKKQAKLLKRQFKILLKNEYF